MPEAKGQRNEGPKVRDNSLVCQRGSKAGESKEWCKRGEQKEARSGRQLKPHHAKSKRPWGEHIIKLCKEMNTHTHVKSE